MSGVLPLAFARVCIFIALVLAAIALRLALINHKAKHRMPVWLPNVSCAFLLLLSLCPLVLAYHDLKPTRTATWDKAFDELHNLQSRQEDDNDAYLTRTFNLLREKNSRISLGECPGNTCMEFILGDLQSTPVGLRQQFLLMGDGFGIKFNPEPGLLLHIDAALRVAGAELVASNPPFVWFYLHKNSTFELLTRQADAKFTAVDIHADSLRIKLEVRPSSLAKIRQHRAVPSASATNGTSAP
jgi:hypothetical protein